MKKYSIESKGIFVRCYFLEGFCKEYECLHEFNIFVILDFTFIFYTVNVEKKREKKEKRGENYEKNNWTLYDYGIRSICISRLWK